MPYQNILVAVDLGATTATVTERAASLASHNNAQLHVLHVIEPLAITYGGDIPMDFSAIQEEIQTQAKEQLDQVVPLPASEFLPESRKNPWEYRPHR